MKTSLKLLSSSAAVLFGATMLWPTGALSADDKISKICQRDGITCASGKHSLIIGPKAQIKNYLGLIEEAETRYAKTFKAKPIQTVLYLAAQISSEDTKTLRSAGYKTFLPWVTRSAQQALARQSIRAQIKAQSTGSSDAEIDAMTEATLTRAGLGMNIEVERGAIAHELAHMWFIRGVWPRKTQEQRDEEAKTPDVVRSQYGSAAPDWLDEMAAVLSENEALNTQRRERAKKIVQSDNLEAFWPLEAYFKMEHPIFRQAQAMLKARGDLKDGMNVVTLTAQQARDLDPADGRSSPDFYAQSQAFADFMIETSKTTYIFDTIARALGNGMSMATWLSKHGQEYGLAANAPALQKQWEGWLKETN